MLGLFISNIKVINKAEIENANTDLQKAEVFSKQMNHVFNTVN
jgi:hypothetical protein